MVPLEEGIQSEEGQVVIAGPVSRLRPLNGMERGLVKRNKGTIRMLLGSALAIPFKLLMSELAVIGGVFSLRGNGGGGARLNGHNRCRREWPDSRVTEHTRS